MSGIAPRVRIGRNRWINLLWLLPIGFAVAARIAIAKEQDDEGIPQVRSGWRLTQPRRPEPRGLRDVSESEARLYAAQYYQPALEDQHLGGGLLWASGDLVALVVLGALFFQWARASEREAVREDRRLDRLDAQAAAERPAPGR